MTRNKVSLSTNLWHSNIVLLLHTMCQHLGTLDCGQLCVLFARDLIKDIIQIRNRDLQQDKQCISRTLQHTFSDTYLEQNHNNLKETIQREFNKGAASSLLKTTPSSYNYFKKRFGFEWIMTCIYRTTPLPVELITSQIRYQRRDYMFGNPNVSVARGSQYDKYATIFITPPGNDTTHF